MREDLEMLRLATHALRDLKEGFPDSEIASKENVGLDRVLREFVGYLQSRGALSEDDWEIFSGSLSGLAFGEQLTALPASPASPEALMRELQELKNEGLEFSACVEVFGEKRENNPYVAVAFEANHVDGVEWAEGPATAVVDPILGNGEPDYDHSVDLDVNGDVSATSNEARTQSDEIGDLLRAQEMGFSVCPDPDQPGMYYFSDPSGEGSDISFESEVAAWKQILAELPTYESMQ